MVGDDVDDDDNIGNNHIHTLNVVQSDNRYNYIFISECCVPNNK